MTLITRYVAREFIKLFALSLVSLVLIYLLIDFFEKVRIFLRYKPDIFTILEYFICQIPKYIYDTAPIAILLSTLIVFGTFSKNNEMTALKSAGISPYKTALPVVGIAAIIGVILLYANTDLIPAGIKQAELVRSVFIEKKGEFSYFRQNKIWFRAEDHVLFNVQLVDPDQHKIFGIGIYKLSDTFSLKESIDARELIYEGSEWYLVSGVKRTFLKGGEIRTEKFDRERITLDITPEDFKQIGIQEDRLKYVELKNYVKKLSAEGYVTTRYWVDLYGRIAFPVVNVIMAIVAIPFGLRNEKRSGGISKGIGISLAIGFSYWVVYALSTSLGHNGMIPPFLSAWLANILFMVIGGYLFLTIRQ
ncbi:MAG: LPS export ABC transporter permease LptG [Nitrospirae bacterium]|nr:LPS export ABC transporter permease LptG [Nitrospirota bacterium]MBI3595013.1 LPS export ABC transporter permease LptG [Nitrospirota bacterium]